MSERLRSRLKRLQPDNGRVSMVIYREPGDTDADVATKVAAVGSAVAVVPRPYKSAVEWLAQHAPR